MRPIFVICNRWSKWNTDRLESSGHTNDEAQVMIWKHRTQQSEHGTQMRQTITSLCSYLYSVRITCLTQNFEKRRVRYEEKARKQQAFAFQITTNKTNQRCTNVVACKETKLLYVEFRQWNKRLSYTSLYTRSIARGKIFFRFWQSQNLDPCVCPITIFIF